MRESKQTRDPKYSDYVTPSLGQMPGPCGHTIEGEFDGSSKVYISTPALKPRFVCKQPTNVREDGLPDNLREMATAVPFPQA